MARQKGDLVAAVRRAAVPGGDPATDLAQPGVDLLDGREEVPLFVCQEKDHLDQVVEIRRLDPEAA